MPLLIDLQRRYGARQLQVIGITIDEAPAKIIAYRTGLAMNYPTLFDQEPGTDGPLRQSLGCAVLPCSVPPSRDGEIVERWPGRYGNGQELE